jgi:hypothetical protein
MISSLLLLSALAHAPASNDRLKPGHAVAVAGAACSGSVSNLGTANTYGSGKSSAVVNVWRITRGANETPLGYIVKTYSDGYWYEPPIALQYVKISKDEFDVLMRSKLSFQSCFTGDLKL